MDAGLDNVVVLTDDYTCDSLAKKLPDGILLTSNVDDIWLRDFCLIQTSTLTKFAYLAKYMQTEQMSMIIQGMLGLCGRFVYFIKNSDQQYSKFATWI